MDDFLYWPGYILYACLMQTLRLLSQLFVWLILLMSPCVNIAVHFQRAFVTMMKPHIKGNNCIIILANALDNAQLPYLEVYNALFVL